MNDRTDNERLASVETLLKIVVDEMSLSRQQNHARIKDDNIMKIAIENRLSTIEQIQKDTRDDLKNYQLVVNEYHNECELERKTIKIGLEGVKGDIADYSSSKRWVGLIIVGIYSMVTLAVAWAKR